jgi:DNA-binding transcriptional ArsR family regulator
MTDTDAVELLRALADPVRWSILTRIASQAEVHQSELEHVADVSRSTISHHVKILRSAGLVQMRKHARHHIYRIDLERLTALIAHLGRHARESADRQRRMTTAPTPASAEIALDAPTDSQADAAGDPSATTG